MGQQPLLPWDLLRLIVKKYLDPLDSLHMSLTCTRLHESWNLLDRRWLACNLRPGYNKEVPWEKFEKQVIERGLDREDWIGCPKHVIVVYNAITEYYQHAAMKHKNGKFVDMHVCLCCYDHHKTTMFYYPLIKSIQCPKCNRLWCISYDCMDAKEEEVYCSFCSEWVNPVQYGAKRLKTV